MDYKEQVMEKAEILKAIGHPVRLCLAKKLCENKECNVTYFMDCMGVSQSSISQHLGKLRDLGIVGYKKDGQNVYYYLKNEDVRKVIKVMFE